MKKTDIKALYDNKEALTGNEVVVAGWVKSCRGNGSFGFIDLTDGTCFKTLQVVFSKDKLENFDIIEKVNTGSSIMCKGKIVLTPENKQPFEMQAEEVTVINATDSEYPLQKKKHSLEFLREIAYLRPRANLFNAVFRVRSKLAYLLHEFFENEGFVHVHTPLLTSSDCEGGSELFRVTTQNIYEEEKKFSPEDELFGKKVYLSPTGQLEGETCAFAFGKIYTFGPSFRAENSNTTRHVNEFWHLEPEVCFMNLDELMTLEEKMMKYIISNIIQKCPDEMQFFNNFVDKGLLDRLNNVINNEFGRVTYTEAIDILSKNNDKFEFPVKWGSDIQTEHERYLAEVIFKKPVFVTDYPKEIKAFYMKQNEDGKTVRACDLLFPGIGEVTGGSERETDYDKLANHMKTLGLKEEDYWWYMNLRKFGSVEHSGFGLGFERILMYITGVSNIRDVILFPRTPNNCEF
ncbi:MAG: asparagine--tRNA ligase [Clostridiales bacterium]|nr:asparagine--tRNA ligase [Clostridiales bacterium]